MVYPPTSAPLAKGVLTLTFFNRTASHPKRGKKGSVLGLFLTDFLILILLGTTSIGKVTDETKRIQQRRGLQADEFILTPSNGGSSLMACEGESEERAPGACRKARKDKE